MQVKHPFSGIMYTPTADNIQIVFAVKTALPPCDGSDYCAVCTIYDLLMAGF